MRGDVRARRGTACARGSRGPRLVVALGLVFALLALSACAGTGFEPEMVAAVGESPDGVATDVGVEGDDSTTADDGTTGSGAETAVDTGPPPTATAEVTPAVLPGIVQVGSLPFGVEAGQGLIWVANSGDDTISLIDPATRLIVSNIFIGAVRGPRSIAVGDKWAVVANTGARSVTLVDVALRTPGPTLSVGEDPVDVVITGDTAWVANALGNSVTMIDLVSESVVQTIPVGMRPEGITAGEGRIFVTNLLDNSVTVLDASNGAGLLNIPVGGGPAAALYHDGQVFVSNGQDGTITVLGATTLTVLNTFELFGEPASLAVGDDGLIWATQLVGGQVKAFDPQTGAVVREEKMGTSSGGIAAINGEIWVSNADDGSLSVIEQP